MKKLIFSVLLVAVVFLNEGEIRGQELLAKNKPCQPSAEAIQSLIQSAYNLSADDLAADSEGVLLAGELRATNKIRLTNRALTLTQALAMLGGTLQTAGSPLYLIRRSTAGQELLEIDLKVIKQKGSGDLILEKGDVIFVPRRCHNGKLLSPTNQNSPMNSPSQRDYPVRVTNKRIALSNVSKATVLR